MNVPAGHSTIAPPGQYEPATHAEHEVEPATVPVPGRHAHAAAPPALPVPGGHAAHVPNAAEAEMAVEMVVPAGHVLKQLPVAA